MRRNSGIIGKKSLVTVANASGLHDTFDAYNHRRMSSWPIVVSYDSLSLNSGTIYENTSQTITLYTSGVLANTTLYWTILHGSSSSADFYNGVVSGSFTQTTSNTGSFSFITNFTPNTSKPTRTFQIQIREGSTSGTVKYTSGTYSIPAVTTSVYWSSSPVNEGTYPTLYVYIGNCGSAYTWTANLGWSGTASAADFTTLPSSMTIGGGTYTYGLTLLNDSTTEGTETLTANVTFGDLFSTIYTIGSATLTINDTSVTINATISSITSTTPNEGTSFTVNVTSGAPNGTTLYWTVENVSAFESADLSATSGSFTITSGAGSFSFNIVADGYTEGTEQFLIRIRRDSISGTILATSSTISIQDTSTGTAEPSAAWTGDVVTSAGTGGSTSPGMCNIWYRRSIIAFVYTSAELAAAFGKNSATITGLRFYVVGQPLNQPLPSYAIGMKLVSTAANVNPGSSGYTIVKNAASESFTSSTTKQWQPFDTSFSWTSGNNLAIIVAWGQCPTNYNGSGQGYYNAGGNIYYQWTDNAGTYTINVDSVSNDGGASRPVVQLYG